MLQITSKKTGISPKSGTFENISLMRQLKSRTTQMIAVGTIDPFGAANVWAETAKEGQVATPSGIAAVMAGWVMGNNPSDVLDPAVGFGGLLEACSITNPTCRFYGIDSDPSVLGPARLSCPNGTKLFEADYLLTESAGFSGIIANPPYIKSQLLAYLEKDWTGFDAMAGIRLGRQTNLYALFILKIWRDLAMGGRAAILVPAEFLNANFGVPVKKLFQEQMRPAGIVIFAPHLNLFPGALTTSALLLLEKSKHQASKIPAIRADSLADVTAFVETNCLEPPSGAMLMGAVPPEEKWLNRVLSPPLDSDVKRSRRIGDYFRCNRGIATGANNFFCLSPSQLKTHRLTAEHVVPCVVKSADISGLVFGQTSLTELVELDRKCYLLAPATFDDDLGRYLELGVQMGVNLRHLPRHRKNWYQPENRKPADILVGVFSREAAKFVLNQTAAKNTTSFHGLYGKDGCTNLAPLATIYLNSTSGRKAFLQNIRFYGNGLNKVEPRDVENIPCPEFPSLNAAQAKALTHRLITIVELAAPDRQAAIDAVLREYCQ